MKKFSIAIHGGAGTILRTAMTAEAEKNYLSALNDALGIGYKILEQGGNANDAVEQAVMNLENCPLFNAGRGSVFTHEGTHEMDAAIMEGKFLRAGAVSIVKNVRNPIQLARAVMDKSQHVMLCGEGAEQFAMTMKLKFENNQYFYNELRYKQWMEMRDTLKTSLDHSSEKKFGTVGAVALDVFGNIAAATSTGGMTNKRFGRVGDTPVIGAGTYANNKTCAVSCTGHGEYFLRAVVAYDISCLMEYKNWSMRDACNFVVNEKLKKFGGEGGLIALDAEGNVEMVFNSDGMYRAMKTSGGKKLIAIY